MAPNITVGDEHPRCDTYTTGQASGMSEHPLVAKCMVFDCAFNQSNDCRANGITVGGHERHADCSTYRSR